jgi:DNA polymerase III epsilon subunit-like protein
VQYDKSDVDAITDSDGVEVASEIGSTVTNTQTKTVQAQAQTQAQAQAQEEITKPNGSAGTDLDASTGDLTEDKQKCLKLLADSKDGEDHLQSSYFDSDTRDRLREMYNSCRGAAVEELVLSSDMLSLMGYSLDATKEGVGFIDTSSAEWSTKRRITWTPSTSKLVGKKAGKSVEVEEGEEEEEGEVSDEDDESWGSDSDDDEKAVNADSDRGKNSNSSNNRSDSIDSSGSFVNGTGGMSNGVVSVLNGSNEIDQSQQQLPLEICALDCEMCYTDMGLELTRISVVCPVQGVVYDTLVKPERPVRDYNTAYSGITEEALADVTTTMTDVHTRLKSLISPRTVIVGHSLDCDLRALLLVHHRVIDTAALFPHPKALPFKLSLKSLALDYLGRSVQTNSGSSGHDSIQDAAIALEIALLKAQPGNQELGMQAPCHGCDVPRCTLFQLVSQSYAEANNCHRSAHSDSTSSGDVRPASSLAGSSLSISVHGCVSMGDRPSWERFSFGYRADAEACTAAKKYREYIMTASSSGASKAEKNGNDRDLCNEHMEVHGAISVKPTADTTTSVTSIHNHKSSSDGVRAAVEELDNWNSDSTARLMWVDLVCYPNCGSHNSHTNNSDSTGDHTFAPLSVNDSDADSRNGAADLVPEEQAATSGAQFRDIYAVDAALGQMYAAAPAGTHMLCVTQADLTKLKLLMSQKQR